MNLKIKLAVFSSAVMVMITPLFGINNFAFDNYQTVQAITGTKTEAISKAVLQELNNLRAQNNETSVSQASALTKLAQSRADHLANINGLDGHSGYNYKDGAPYTAIAGENIGYWYNSKITDPKVIAKEIIQNLYDDVGVADYGHRKNMLDPYFKHVGIGVSINPTNGYIFYAQDFGTTSSELGNDRTAAIAYAQYTQTNGLSAQYPTQYDQNASSSSYALFPGATKINSVVSTSQLTPLYDAPTGGKKSNRSLAPKTDWYTDQVYTDQNGNNWYRVSTSEWALINQAKIKNLS